MKTFENYLDGDRLWLEQSCDDGSIVKVQVYNRKMDDWIDATEKGKRCSTVGALAEECYQDYLRDRKILSSKTPLRDMMPDILGLKKEA